MKRRMSVAIFLATGFEEVEALTTVDLLKRAEIEVDMVSVREEKEVSGAHGITVIAEQCIKDIDFTRYDALILPGGMPGTLHLGENEKLMAEIESYSKKDKVVAAICAAPSLLGRLGVLEGKRACCYPGFEKELVGANVTMNKVEIDGNIITSRGVGTVIDFALAIIKILVSEEASKTIAKNILV